MEGQIGIFTHNDVVGLFGGVGTVDAENLVLINHLQAGREMVFFCGRIHQWFEEFYIPVDILADHGGFGYEVISQFVTARILVPEQQLAFY